MQEASGTKPVSHTPAITATRLVTMTGTLEGRMLNTCSPNIAITFCSPKSFIRAESERPARPSHKFLNSTHYV